jgi:hypothetical protein
MDDKNNKLLEILARKKAQQNNNSGNFNPNNGKKIKPQKGFGGPAVTRKTGRGS